MTKWVDGVAFAPYTEWECWKSGLYHPTVSAEAVAESASVLRSYVRFRELAAIVPIRWPVSAAIHLSNDKRNRRAYIGAAACFIAHGATIDATHEAWWRLTAQEQKTANQVATDVVNEWLTLNAEHCQKPNAQLEFLYSTLREPE